MIRGILVRVIVVSIGVGFGIISAEVGLRITGFAHVPEPIQVPFPKSYYVRDEAASFDIAENFPPADFKLPDYARAYGKFFKVWSNQLGCFDGPQSSGQGKVLLVGDSFTWGYVPFEASWGTLVEQEAGVPILKCGVGAYGPRLVRLKVDKISRRIGRPSLIIVGYFVGNDLEDDYLFPRMTVVDGHLATRTSLANEATGERRVHTDAEIQASAKAALEEPQGLDRVKRYVVGRSVLYNLLRGNSALRKVMWQMGLAEPPPASPIPLVFRSTDRFPWIEEAWKSHFDSLRQLQRQARSLGAKFLVVVIPTKEQVYEFLRPQDERVQWERPNARLHELFEAEQIQSLDLLREFQSRARQAPKRTLQPGRDLYWTSDPHFNIEGNRLAGLLVSRYLLEHRLVDPRDREQRLASIQRELARSTSQSE